MSSGKRKLIYIAGAGRMGSTLLGNILEQIDGFFYGGEMHTLHRHGIEGEVPCSCGTPVKQCEVWHEILIKGFGSIEAARTELQQKAARQYGPTRLPAMMVGPLRRRFLESLNGYLDAVAKLYGAIYETTGSRVIVDSSHKALYGAVLETMPEVEFYVIHLVRDPRAYMFSWMRPRNSQDPNEASTAPGWSSKPVVVCPLWCLNNLAVERILHSGRANHLMLRYEDFLQNPRATIERILDLVDEKPERLPFVDASSVELATSHACYGNRSRFKTGTVELRFDDAWKRDMRRSDRWMVNALTWPMILRYGYFHG